MLTPVPVKPVDRAVMEEIGFHWHTDPDGSGYIANELLDVTQEEAEAYYEAGIELYRMFREAGEYVITNNLLFDIGIPFNMIDMVRQSWSNSVHQHLYGRFDLAGGIDGEPIKLIEFNADTPTAVFETSVVQWAMLKANGMDEDAQYNDLYEGLKENFKRLITLEEDPGLFEKYYDGWKILFSCGKENAEEEGTVRFLQMCAEDAGFNTGFCYLDEVQFDEAEGIFDAAGENYEYWFKLFPWEDIALEDELPLILTDIMKNQKAIILNPAYTLMFQSKGFMKILCDLFPDSPYLLKAGFKPLEGIKQVEKKFFGREGANVTISDANGETIVRTDGDYANHNSLYQEYVELPKNSAGEYYQAGLFFAHEPVALAFRKGGLVMDNYAKFVGHRLI